MIRDELPAEFLWAHKEAKHTWIIHTVLVRHIVSGTDVHGVFHCTEHVAHKLSNREGDWC